MKKILSIVAAVLFAGSMLAAEFVKTPFASIKSTDVVIITASKGDKVYAMSTEKSAQNNPAAQEIAVVSDKITTDADTLQWNVVIGEDKDSCIIYPAGDDTQWLYCNKSSNAIRLGTGAARGFQVKQVESSGENYDYLYNKTFTSYVGVSNSSDWRHYATIGSAIKEENLAFFVKTSATSIDNNAVQTKAVKMIENGRLVIIKNGVKYDALGAIIQ